MSGFEKKKSLAIEVTSPRRPGLLARFLITVFSPFVLFIGLLFRTVYRVCFGWLDRRLARKAQQFADEIRNQLAFLFNEHSAKFVPNEGVPFSPSFDGTYVTVAVDSMRLLFITGRGDFSVKVASEFAPQEWLEFPLVADGIGRWDEEGKHAYNYSLQDFRGILRLRLAHLQESLSKERFAQTIEKAIRIHNESIEKSAERLKASGAKVRIFES